MKPLCCTVFCTSLAVVHSAAVCAAESTQVQLGCPTARQVLFARSLHILQADFSRRVQQGALYCYRTRLSTVKLMAASIGFCGPLAAHPCHRSVLQLATSPLPTQPSSVQQAISS